MRRRQNTSFRRNTTPFTCTLFQKKKPHVRNFSPAILGLEMAVPILWAPGIFWFFLLETPLTIKFLVLGGAVGFLEGGWKCQFYFYGRSFFVQTIFV